MRNILRISEKMNVPQLDSKDYLIIIASLKMDITQLTEENHYLRNKIYGSNTLSLNNNRTGQKRMADTEATREGYHLAPENHNNNNGELSNIFTAKQLKMDIVNNDEPLLQVNPIAKKETTETGDAFVPLPTTIAPTVSTGTTTGAASDNHKNQIKLLKQKIRRLTLQDKKNKEKNGALNDTIIQNKILFQHHKMETERLEKELDLKEEELAKIKIQMSEIRCMENCCNIPVLTIDDDEIKDEDGNVLPLSETSSETSSTGIREAETQESS